MIQFLIHFLARFFATDQSEEGLAKIDSSLERDVTGVRPIFWWAFVLTFVIIFIAIVVSNFVY